jgi:hypothetical protein
MKQVSISKVHAQLGLCAAAVAGTAAISSNVAEATLVTTFQNTNLPVPATLSGVYINLETGGTGTSAAGTAGWDFNPYQTSSGLGFYWSPSPLVGGQRAGGVETAPASGLYADMAPGSTVGAANSFTSAIQGTSANFRSTGNHILGMRFVNAAGIFNYGYVKITTTAGTGSGNGFPATITGWVFDDSGATVTIPGGGQVPEPASAAILALATGALGVRRIGRKR